MTTSVDWELLLSQIEKERCVLFIGPDLLTKSHGPSFQQKLKSWLENKNGQEMPYYSEDEFFSFQRKTQKRRTYNAIQSYFEAQETHEIHRLLAKIPFHLILSLSPDHLLVDSFGEEGFSCQFDYYKMGKNPEPLPPPTSGEPLIYNLLGSSEDDHSLVFSYEDLFTYLEGMFGAYDLPDALREALQDAEHLVFLGIQYEKWYMKLLLRLLRLHEEKFIEAFSQEGVWEDELKSYYQEHFEEINFFETEGEAFVRELYSQCEARGLLRGKGEFVKEDILQLVQQYIADNRTLEALNQLKEYGKRYQPDWLNELALLTGQLNQLEQEKRVKTIDREPAEIRLNQLHHSLLSLAQSV